MSVPLNDPAWLERMYNNRAMVPDHLDYFHRWAEESARVRATQPVLLDVAYGSGPGETLDVFPAARTAPDGVPVLVFIHGGYWRSLDKSDHSFIAPAFTEAGACVVVVNYALCPGTPDAPVTVAHIVGQMEKALAWVAGHIAGHGGHSRRVTVAGHSAGGQLAAMLLTRGASAVERDLPVGPVRNALSISGIHDLEPLMHTPLYQSVLHLTDQQVQQCSPARLPKPASGHLHCVVGGEESTEFQRQNQLMQNAWGNDVVPRSQVMAGLHHFSIVDALATPGHDVHRMALNLLQA